MQINQGFVVGGVGYVRAVFSRRARGHAVPFDLLRAHCRALMWSGVRRRLRADFAGYLVTESEVAAFSDRRKNYAPRRVGLMNTGFPMPSNFGGDIDAPGWIASGAMRWIDRVGPFPVASLRGLE